MSTREGESSGTLATSTPPASQRPLITLEPFSETGTFSEWIEHFKAVATINNWDDASKLLWLRVRLVGGAQTAYGRLPAEAKGSYAELRKPLKGHFELKLSGNATSPNFKLERRRRPKVRPNSQML